MLWGMSRGLIEMEANAFYCATCFEGHQRVNHVKILPLPDPTEPSRLPEKETYLERLKRWRQYN